MKKEADYFERIRFLREKNELNQSDVANQLDMHVTQYARYERGESSVPASFIVKLANFYRVSTDYLLGLTNNKSRK